MGDAQKEITDLQGEWKMQEESNLKVVCFSRWQELEKIRPAWGDLLLNSPCLVGAFSTYEFCKAWWDAYVSSDELFILVCTRADGDVVAIAPLFRQKERGEFVLRLIGDTSDDVDGFDCIVKKGFESNAAKAWIRWLLDHRASWSRLELNSVPTESPVLHGIRVACESSGLAIRESFISHRGIVLPTSWDEYLRKLSAKMRFSISHQHRALKNRYQLTLRKSDSEAESLQWLRVLVVWQKTRWSYRGIQGKFEIEQRRRFYESFVSALSRNNTLSFWAMFADDRLVALELGCMFRDQYIGIHPSFDPDLASFSPGVVLRALVLQKLIEQGTTRYDFGAGDETYKVRWANETRSFSNFSCAPRWSRRDIVSSRPTAANPRCRKSGAIGSIS